MQPDAVVGQALDRVGEDAVVKHHRRVGAGGARVADRVHEAQLAAAVRRQVLDQQHPLAFGHRALNPGVAAVALGLLADIGHGQAHPFGHEGGEGDARGLAARDVVERLESCVPHDGGGKEIHQRAADARVRDELAAVDVGRPLQARGVGVGLGRVEVDGPDLQQHPGGQAGDFLGRGEGKRHASSSTCQWIGKPGSKTVTVSSPAVMWVGTLTGWSRRVRVIRSSAGGRP